MGISLNGLTPAGTYPGLIKTGDNTAISGTPKVLSDGNGNNLPMEVSTTGVNLTGSPTVNAVAIANTTQVAAKQDTLVSGTNIKTINGASLLGSGNIPVVTSPSGVSGAIQFSNGSAFASDAANLFWDDTNNRLAVGSNNPYAATLQVKGGGADISSLSMFVENSVGLPALIVRNNGTVNLPGNLFAEADISVGNGNSSLSARLGVKGTGSTSATTSLLVQNSAGRQIVRATDNGLFQVGTADLSSSLTQPFAITASSGNNATMALFAQGGDNAGMDFYRNGAFKFNAGIGGGSDNFAWYNGAFGNYSFYILSDATGRTVFGGATGSASAQVAIDSTTRGFLPPRMTTTQKNNINAAAAGLVVYDSTTNKLQCYNGSTWNDLF
jgi:hypothetical protein